MRHLLTQDVDEFTDVDRSLYYDLTEELCDGYEAVSLRRASGKRRDRSNIEGDRSNIEGDRSNLEGDRGTGFGAGAT